MSAESASKQEPQDDPLAEESAGNGSGEPTLVENDAVDPPEETGETSEAKLAAQVAELQDRVLRGQAEFQNFRRRSEKERLEFSQYASMEAVRELLPILDDFERALGVECADAEYVKGMQLIHQRVAETLKKLGLEPMESEGQIFDPNLHHAVEMVETDEAPDQTVLGEFQKGYNFKGRLLRAAMVKVAVNPSGEKS